MEMKDIIDEFNELFSPNASLELIEKWEKTLPPIEELKRDALEIVEKCDDLEFYQAIFNYLGESLTKEEYVRLKAKYVKTFDLDFFPLPESCEELDKKWGL